VFYTDIPSCLLNQLDAIFASRDGTHTYQDKAYELESEVPACEAQSDGTLKSDARVNSPSSNNGASGQQQFSFDDE